MKFFKAEQERWWAGLGHLPLLSLVLRADLDEEHEMGGRGLRGKVSSGRPPLFLFVKFLVKYITYKHKGTHIIKFMV